MEKIKQTKIAVHSEEENRRVQEKLFELGCKWVDGNTYNYMDSRYLYISGNLEITQDKNDKKFFDFHKYTEIYVEDLLSLKKETRDKIYFNEIELKLSSEIREVMFGTLEDYLLTHIKILAEQELYDRGIRNE